MKLFSAWTTENEYGKKGTLLGFTYLKEDAEILAADQGWYGGSGTILEHDSFLQNGLYHIIDASMPLLQQSEINVNLVEKKQSLKEKALAKLTEAEKKALDLV